MRRKLALRVEWEWSQGKLSDFTRVDAFSELYLYELRAQFPTSQRGCLKLGLEQIKGDVQHTLRVLRYGGRKPRDLTPARLDFLKQAILTNT